MLSLLLKLLLSSFALFANMSPYLLLGFGIAGILRILIPTEKVVVHLGGKNFVSILKAVIVGIPLPLCSCGVLPVATSLRRQGASKPATLAFLVSTPTTGIDSILATYSLMGTLFAIARPIASFIAGIIVGLISIIITKEKVSNPEPNPIQNCSICEINTPHKHTLKEKIITALRYGYIEVVEDISKWILIGVIVGGLINIFLPPSIVETYAGNTLKGIIWMLAIGIPMYVCATGSIPIAASLIGKGMSPGAALVFLIAGPATNTVGISVIARTLGKRQVIAYLLTIILTAVSFAFAFDYLFPKKRFFFASHIHTAHNKITPLNYISSLILLFLILYSMIPKKGTKKMSEEKLITFYVPDITCSHCERVIKEALLECSGVEDVFVDLKKKTVSISGNADIETLKRAIESAGYEVK